MLTTLHQKNKVFKDKVGRFFSYQEIVRIFQCLMTAGVTLSAMPIFAMAGGADDMFGTLVGYVCKIFFYIGAILLVWAVGQLVLAFKNEDADSKSRAVMVLVCAVLLMSIGTIYDTVAGKMGDNPVKRDESVKL